jgi:hypothetical protein
MLAACLIPPACLETPSPASIEHHLPLSAKKLTMSTQALVLVAVTSSPKSRCIGQKMLKLDYKKANLLFECHHTKTSSLDPIAVRPAQHGFPSDPFADPQMPIASEDYEHQHLCMNNGT